MDRFREVNAELKRSLERCQVLLEDCRSKLAANSNDPETSNDDTNDRESAAD